MWVRVKKETDFQTELLVCLCILIQTKKMYQLFLKVKLEKYTDLMTVQIKTTDSFVFVKVKISSLGTLFFFTICKKRKSECQAYVFNSRSELQ